ncbi:Transmembrane protein [Ceratobasidium theobromae]|uniref:Transmembrane protein n=1 Tax=Ceratobasidium theobromae TaxID=1582974 RepID=A0A5N5QTY8_9AGAM|nr:Transmembrane protein [Ceratobasidium theobromae]
MRSFPSRNPRHNRNQSRQLAPIGPIVAPRQDPSYSVYLATGVGATATAFDAAMPTATALVLDSTAVETFYPTPLSVVRPTQTTPSTSEEPTTSSTDAASATATALSVGSIALDPAQRVYDGIADAGLRAHSPAVIGIASGGAALIVLLALYCYICRWYYRRLPRSTARWDVDDRAKKDVFYGDKPNYSPEGDQPPQLAEDRRAMPVGDSYFPEGETWQKFEGRTAHHPESFIYTGPGLPQGMGPASPESPENRRSPGSAAPLARPRPRFADNSRRAQVESVFSNVSFPTTHRAESMRHSFYPEGYEHDGEVWDLASPGFANEGVRPSFDSSRSINRASIFGEASARARGSVVIYEAQPVPMRPPTLAEDPFASPGERPIVLNIAGTKSFDAGKKSFDAVKRSFDSGKRSMEGFSRPRDVRIPLDTLAEDADEATAHAHGTFSSSRSFSRV